ncbi:sodium:solute symporter family transporter [Poriferisphaera sp. WC338]|uniref:sodium:solute symporter family transporter n=1 Tax=Poriferisphaera sp. WC338 TaxID=3425129 RepID=UPI003D815ABA
MNFLSASPVSSGIMLSMLDWIAIGVFLFLVVCAAMWARFQQKGRADFFLAGRSMSWVVVTFSTFATLFSTISFVAIPGEAYDHGLMLSLTLIVGAMFYPLGVWLFLRFFFNTQTYTAYEYLERRFNLPTRLGGAMTYCIIRLLYGGTVFYAAAKVFESLAGWPMIATVLVIGVFTIIYTATGGMKAVMITDTIQGVIVVIGIGAILYTLLQITNFDIQGIYTYASENGRGYEGVVQPEFYRMNLFDRFSLWLLLIASITTPLATLSADQSVLQRLLASKSYKHARRAVIVNAFTAVPVVGMLWLIGIGLSFLYTSGKTSLPSNIESDHVLGFFISSHLPAPFPGLITAALLAALMSTIDSTVNCIANVIHCDFLVRLRVVGNNSNHEMLVCRLLSILIGLVCVGLAVLMTLANEGIQSNILEITGIWSSLWLVLLAVFLIGVLAPRVTGKHIFIGMVLGGMVSLYLPYTLYYATPADERISFMWVGVPGMLITITLPLLLSLLWPDVKSTEGLTLWSIKNKSNTSKISDPVLVN